MKLLPALAALMLLIASAASQAETAATPAAPEPKSPVVSRFASPADMPKTLRALETQLEADGWGVLSRINLGERLAKKGVEVPGGLVILEMANCKNAAPLLRDDETRYLSALMPCRISVYGTQGGQVVVARLNNAHVGALIAPLIEEVMRGSDEHLNDSIRHALQKLGTGKTP